MTTDRIEVEVEGRKYALIPTNGDHDIFRVRKDGSLGKRLFVNAASLKVYGKALELGLV